MASLFANPKYPNDSGWQTRHNAAITAPKPGAEEAMVGLLKAWAAYAEMHKAKFESPIGEDGVLGDYWLDIGKGIRGLLNGDCGTLDAYILGTAEEHGITEEEIE